MKLSLATPDKKIADGIEIDELIVPGYRGQLDILPGHAPLVTTLTAGTLKYRVKGSSTFESVVVSWGFCEVHPDGVIVLAETAETLEEINRERALAALANAKKMIVDPSLDVDQIVHYQRMMKKAEARIEALKQSH